jgi:hypothetical protein
MLGRFPNVNDPVRLVRERSGQSDDGDPAEAVIEAVADLVRERMRQDPETVVVRLQAGLTAQAAGPIFGSKTQPPNLINRRVAKLLKLGRERPDGAETADGAAGRCLLPRTRISGRSLRLWTCSRAAGIATSTLTGDGPVTD